MSQTNRGKKPFGRRGGTGAAGRTGQKGRSDTVSHVGGKSAGRGSRDSSVNTGGRVNSTGRGASFRGRTAGRSSSFRGRDSDGGVSLRGRGAGRTAGRSSSFRGRDSDGGVSLRGRGAGRGRSPGRNTDRGGRSPGRGRSSGGAPKNLKRSASQTDKESNKNKKPKPNPKDQEEENGEEIEEMDEIQDSDENEDEQESDMDSDEDENEGGNDQSEGEKKKQEEDEKKKRKKEQRQQMLDKKKEKPHGEARLQIKILWADVGKKKDAAKTQQSISEMLSLMEDGKLITEFAMKRDLSRIIQSILKYGNEEQKNIVQEHLKDHVVDLSKNNYAYYLVVKMLYYGTKEQRSAIIEKFYGHVRQLVRHKNASNVVEAAYITYANSLQRKSLLEEFYGPEFSLFKAGQKQTLKEILNENPLKRVTILGFMKNYLFELTNKPDILRNSIVHKPLLQYLELAKDSEKVEMAGFMSEHLKTFLHSKDGARAAVICIQYAQQKERKVIVKSFKGYVKKISLEQYGHWAMLALFKYVDDTVLVSKLIIKEMLQHTKELLVHKYGRLSFLAIIKGVVVPYFPPEIVKFMEPKFIEDPQNAETKIGTSKKNDEKRKEELLNNLLMDLTNSLMDAEAIYDYVTSENASDVIKELFDHITPEVKFKLLDLILSWIDFTPKEERKYHPMEKKPEPKVNIVTHPVSRVFLSRLIKNHPSLSDKIMEKVEPNLLDYARDANGSWVVLRLLQNPSTKDKVKSILLPIVADLLNPPLKDTAPLSEELKK